MKDTQRGNLPHIPPCRQESRDDSVILDAATRRNLEIDVNLSGGDSNTLLSVMDRSVTAMGSRMLRRWLHRPLTDIEVIWGTPGRGPRPVRELRLRTGAQRTQADRRHGAHPRPGSRCAPRGRVT